MQQQHTQHEEELSHIFLSGILLSIHRLLLAYIILFITIQNILLTAYYSINTVHKAIILSKIINNVQNSHTTTGHAYLFAFYIVLFITIHICLLHITQKPIILYNDASICRQKSWIMYRILTPRDQYMDPVVWKCSIIGKCRGYYYYKWSHTITTEYVHTVRMYAPATDPYYYTIYSIILLTPTH